MLSSLAQVDNTNEIKKIYDLAIDAIASIIKLLESNGNLDNVLDNLFETHIPTEFEMLTKWPQVTSFKVSLLNLIRNNELPSPLDVYYTYRSLFLPSLSNFRFYFILLRIIFL